MMKPHLLFTLMYFCLELEAHDLSPPKLTVDVSVIKKTDSVTLKCQSSSTESTSECSFFAQSETLFVGRCLQNITGAEILIRTKRRSPATVEVRCSYTVKEGNFHFTSVESDPSTIEINNLLRPDLTVNPRLISEKDSVTLNCQTSVSLTECSWHFKGKSRARRFSCSKTLTGAELIEITSLRVPAKVRVSCSYLDGTKSPESEQKTITIQLPQPELRVNPAVITERDSATLNCVSPSSLSVSECHFYFLKTKTTKSSSCMQTLTAAELLSMSSQRSPADVELTCFYSVEEQEGNSQSPRSNVSYIHISVERKRTSVTSADSWSGDLTTGTPKISDLLPPDLTVNPRLISEKDSVTLNCQTSVSLTECFWLFKGKSRAQHFSCSKTLTGAELIEMTSLRVPAKVTISCFYLNGTKSPESEEKTITIQFPQPELRVNPAVITERDSATLNCVSPSSLSVSECHFYFLKTKITKSSSCMQTLTAAELLSMSSQRSPADVELTCFYSVEEQEGNSQSPRSNVSYIHIKNTPTTTQRTSPYRTTSVISTTIEEILSTSTTVNSASSTRRSLHTSLMSTNPQPAVTEETRTTTTTLLTSYVTSVTQSTESQSDRTLLYVVVIGPGFGVTVGIILLGVTLLCSKRRSKTRATKR
ncbi:hypothetical protein OJAV_G00048040 [Oryzias javanicus]|uniref:Ig-like domain-containing protein n=1 Tax=Oryzias javanicus TaxID=123683 RepID=A0A437DEA8_ORYJA|nr:hypothetical protein OJAV_G00048040 [Oryzias javanicus]